MSCLYKLAALFALVFFSATTTWATPGVNELTQQIATECQNLIFAAMLNPTLESQIESECPVNNAGSQITTVETSRQQITLITSTLSNAILNAFLGRTGGRSVAGNFYHEGRTGLNAGELLGNIGVWGSFNYNNLDDEFLNTRYDSTTRSFLVGADTQPMENMIAGLAFGYEDSDVDTLFNSGEQDRDGFTVAGYLGYLINDYFSIDVSAGYSGVDIDQFRTATGIDPNFAAGSRVNSEVDADRLFIAGNLNGFWSYNNWILMAQAGYLRAEEDHDSYTETSGVTSVVVPSRDFDLGQWHVGANVAYDYRSFLEPYFSVSYLNEDTRERVVAAPGQVQPDNDDDEVLFTLGMRYFGTQGITGDIQYNISSGREDIDNSNLMLLIRAEL